MLPRSEESGDDTHLASTQPGDVNSADTDGGEELRGGAAAAAPDGSDSQADPEPADPPAPAPEPMKTDEVPCPLTTFQTLFPHLQLARKC